MSLTNPRPILLTLTAQTPISHGDPGAASGSNVTPFRMQEILYERAEDSVAADDLDPIGEEPETLRTRNLCDAEAAIRDLAYSYPLPIGSALAIAIQQLTAEQFVASAFVFSLISCLNKQSEGDGLGLFSGKSRYDQFLKRLAIVGSQYQTSFFNLYAALLRELRIEDNLWEMTDLLWRYAALPRAVQQAAIATMTKDRQAVVTIARAWFEANRKERALEREGSALWNTLLAAHEYYDPAGKVAGASLIEAEAAIPWISSNAFRHTVFRETLRDHLFASVGFGSPENALKAVPRYVAMLFSNGGNMRAGATAPDTSNAINAAIARMFPSIELLGGCVPTHIMPGKLSLPIWTLCLQNNQNTRPYGFVSDVDASALLTVGTFTRHTPDGMPNDKDSGQMIFDAPVLKPGAHLLMQVSLAPFTSRLAAGAASFALHAWLDAGGQVGGRDNLGFGRLIRSEEISPDRAYYEDAAGEYEQYIASHMEQIEEALVSGSLGWTKRLDTWS